MSTALEIASLIALILFIILVLCLIPTVFYVRRKLADLLLATRNLEAELHIIVQDSRELVQNVNALTQRVNEQLDDAGKVVHVVARWADMANRLVTAVGMIIEPPVTGLARNISLFRLGLSVFTQVLCSKKPNKQPNEEEDHV
ncbi:MAG: DUF948 domain-containing protein [Victivallaceae bacterium]|jgi:uncharacterized protein YoxC